jgi:ankyrin repeat protein
MKMHTLSFALLCATITTATRSMDQKPVDAELPALADVLNIPDKGGFLPLHKLITIPSFTDEQRVNLIERFTQHHANINALVDKAAKNYPGNSTLHLAVIFKSSAVVLEALVKHGADMRALDLYNRTPLSLAVDCAHDEQIETLLKHIPDAH